MFNLPCWHVDEKQYVKDEIRFGPIIHELEDFFDDCWLLKHLFFKGTGKEGEPDKVVVTQTECLEEQIRLQKYGIIAHEIDGYQIFSLLEIS